MIRTLNKRPHEGHPSTVGKARLSCSAFALLCAASAGCLPAEFHELSEGEHDRADACASTGDGNEYQTGCDPSATPDAEVCDACSDGSTWPGRDAALVGGDAQVAPDEDAAIEPPASDDASAPSCLSAAECEPGQVEMDTQPCGACGTGQHTRLRSCSYETCTWSAWSDFGECAGVTAACSPGQTTGCANGDDCGHRVCTDSCTWSGCQPKAGAACLRIGEGHTDMGSNYRCCGDMMWQFCLPNCQWSMDCTSCTNCTDCNL